MKNKYTETLRLTMLAVAVAWAVPAAAQSDGDNAIPEPAAPLVEEDDAFEELIVTGRFIDSSQQLVNERMNDAFATDLLGSETISRLGDSTVAAALRRVPGLTLVQDKFVYIRGLGERYSQTTLNGAYIPSPDLTRNVIPLNVFPTSVVESLKVQKSYSPSLSANFGGGAVDIRTKGIPDDFTVKFEFGLGVNSENPSKVLTYPGGGDDSLGTDDGFRALPSEVLAGVVEYQGFPNTNTIHRFLRGQDPTASLFGAQTINRNLAIALNRDIGVEETSSDPDYKFRGSIGNNFLIGTDWEAGFNVGGSYETDWRWRRTRTAAVSNPAEQNGTREETTRSINIASTLNLGLKFTEDHEVATTTLFLRNTDDEMEVFDFFNENSRKSDGQGFRDYRFEYEERNMVTNQITGTHYLGEATRDKFQFLDSMLGWLPTEARLEWFYSDSNAQTEIPNRVIVSSETDTDRDTGAVLADRVVRSSSAAQYRFTDLDDEVENYGWKGLVPLEFGRNYVEIAGGYDHAQKARKFEQAEFSIGFLTVADSAVLQGSLDSVFSDENILARPTDNPLTARDESEEYIHDFQFDRQGSNTNSYLAATMTDSAWGSVDWTWNDTWRVALGARWEDYRQAAVQWNPFGFSLDDPQVDIDPNDPNFDVNEITFAKDAVYPSAGITYIGDFWAETFQLRFGYSETAVRPDLRELTGSSYIDPITGDLVRGNPGVVPSDVENIDLRAEWFFGNGDNLTVTLFKKDIENPIEFFEIPASDTTIAREVVNASSATVEGVEIEALKELAFLGGFFDTLFVQGNVTFQDSELVAGPNANVPTSPVRQLSGASDYVVNVMLGFDSPDSKHTASLIFNVFGERLFVAGRNGAPDGFEQPFESLDFTYFWYPTDKITFKAKAQNVLGSTIDIERADVVVFEEDPGTTFSLALQWGF